MPRILVLADLGQSVYHVGDEAMGIATAAELTRRGYEVFIATQNIDRSQAYIGSATGYIKTLDFPAPPAEREIFLGQVRQHLAGHPASEDITTFVRQVADMDGIVIAGGGNMNSATGHLLYERAAYALVAQAHEIPLVISGQSVGPVLTDAETLRDMLSSAQLVGMRERFSQAWARNAAIDSHLIVDDATFYQHQKRSLPGRPVVDLPEHYICATFSGLAPGQARVIGQLLDDMHREYGLRTVFLPHMGEPLTDHRAMWQCTPKSLHTCSPIPCSYPWCTRTTPCRFTAAPSSRSLPATTPVSSPSQRVFPLWPCCPMPSPICGYAA